MMVFDLNPFKPVTLFQQQKRVTRKCRSLPKFLTAKNGLFLGANRVVVPNVSLQALLKWRPARRPLAICPQNKPSLAETLKAETAVAEPPKAVSTKPMFLLYLLLYP
jgi:hypothetical protein